MIRLKYFPTQDYSFLLDENHYVYDHIETEDSLHIYIKSKEHSCACPVCGKMSSTPHATYKRKFQDTPIHCKQTFSMQMCINMTVKIRSVTVKFLWKTSLLQNLHKCARMH